MESDQIFVAPGPGLALDVVGASPLPTGVFAATTVYRSAGGPTGFDANEQARGALRMLVQTRPIYDRSADIFVIADGSDTELAACVRTRMRPVALVVDEPDVLAQQEMAKLPLRKTLAAANAMKARFGRPTAPLPTTPFDSLQTERWSTDTLEFLASHARRIQVWGKSEFGLHFDLVAKDRSALDLSQDIAATGLRLVTVDDRRKLPVW